MVPELTGQKQLTCNIYPNPAVSEVHIVFEAPLKEKATLRIVDNQGRMVKLDGLGAGISETILDLSGVSQGLYLLIIQSPHFMITRKISVVN